MPRANDGAAAPGHTQQRAAGVRARKQYLGNMRLAWFLILYICALDSKEMAVTLPAVLVAY